MGRSVEWVVVSSHAAERWHQRTKTPGVGPIVAWNEAERREISDLDADEIRYHKPTGTLLLKNGGVLVTVIEVATARQPIRKAVEL